MKRLSVPVAASLTLVFLSGGAAGYLGHRYLTVSEVKPAPTPTKRSPEEFRQRYMEEMKTRLKLSPDQVSKLTVILDETRDRMRALRERSDVEMKSITQAQTEKIAQILDETQRTEYAQMRKEREERRKAMDRDKGSRGGQGPGPNHK